MKYYIFIKNNRIDSVLSGEGIPEGADEITKEKYDRLMLIHNKPEDTLETHYYLSAETETYVGRETTHAERVDWYVRKMISEEMTLNEVPVEYREEVSASIPQPQEPTYTSDEWATMLAEEVSNI